jgi:hypothetical protein
MHHTLFTTFITSHLYVCIFAKNGTFCSSSLTASSHLGLEASINIRCYRSSSNPSSSNPSLSNPSSSNFEKWTLRRTPVRRKTLRRTIFLSNFYNIEPQFVELVRRTFFSSNLCVIFTALVPTYLLQADFIPKNRSW